MDLLKPVESEKLTIDAFVKTSEENLKNILKAVYKPSSDWLDIDGGGFFVTYKTPVLRTEHHVK